MKKSDAIFAGHSFHWIIVVIFIVTGALFYNTGYRIQNFSLVKTGSLTMTLPEPGTWVFIGGTPAHTSTSVSENITLPDITPGKNIVTVIKKGYWPWAKHITLTSGEHKTLYPFTLKKNISATPLTSSHPNYRDIYFRLYGNQNIVTTTYSTPENILVEAHESTIMVSCDHVDPICTEEIEVSAPITSIATYADNSRIVIYSTAEKIVITELSSLGGRISHTIYTGENLRFYKEKNILYIGDNRSIVRLAL